MCGYGRADKRQVQRMAKVLLGWSGPSSVSASFARGDRQEVFLALQEPPFGAAW